MKLLFICTHNRCRSILAEAIANQVGSGKITAFSAGSSPQDAVHPMSLHHLQQSGYNTAGLKSQSWDEFESLEPDAIITLCDKAASESCPVWFDGSVMVHWGFPDPSNDDLPADQQKSKFERTMEVLNQRVNALTQSSMIDLRGEELRSSLEKIAEAFPSSSTG